MQEQAMTHASKNPIEPFRQAMAAAQRSFADALPATVAKYLTPERLAKITLAAVSRSPDLLRCSPQSVLRAVMDAASLGLEPTGGALGQAYLVPFNSKGGGKEAQLIVGYRGFIALARRSGEILSVEAHVVYERDSFDLAFGREPKLAHRPLMAGERGEIIAAYVIADLKGGARQVEVMTRAEIDAVRSRSRAGQSGPWVTDFAEMCRKTVVRRAAKYWPLSLELARALDIEDSAEAGTEPPVMEIVEMKPEGQPGKMKRLARKVAEHQAQPEPVAEPEREAVADDTGEASSPITAEEEARWANVGPPPMDEPGANG